MIAAADFPGTWRPNTNSGVALFEQLRLRIIELADSGVLAVGAKLPPVRNLAGLLDVAPHTVARAYKELEAAGVVATRGRNGTVVCARDDRWGALAEVAANYAAAAKAQGASFAEAVQLLAAAYDADWYSPVRCDQPHGNSKTFSTSIVGCPKP